MLSAIVSFSLRFKGVVVALSCVLLGYGLYVAANSKLDVFPNFVPPQVTVQTEAPGLSPEQVESLVTVPVEKSTVVALVKTPARPTSDPVPAVVGTAMIGAILLASARVHQSSISSRSHTESPAR